MCVCRGRGGSVVVKKRYYKIDIKKKLYPRKLIDIIIIIITIIEEKKGRASLQRERERERESVICEW